MRAAGASIPTGYGGKDSSSSSYRILLGLVSFPYVQQEISKPLSLGSEG